MRKIAAQTPAELLDAQMKLASGEMGFALHVADLDGQAFVLIQVGSAVQPVTPDQAREIGRDLIRLADAAEGKAPFPTTAKE